MLGRELRGVESGVGSAMEEECDSVVNKHRLDWRQAESSSESSWEEDSYGEESCPSSEDEVQLVGGELLLLEEEESVLGGRTAGVSAASGVIGVHAGDDTTLTDSNTVNSLHDTDTDTDLMIAHFTTFAYHGEDNDGVQL